MFNASQKSNGSKVSNKEAQRSRTDLVGLGMPIAEINDQESDGDFRDSSVALNATLPVQLPGKDKQENNK